MRTGQCFITHKEDSSIKGYFFTGLHDNGKLVMCEMVRRPEEITKDSYWLLSEDEFDKAVEAGTIELI